MRAKKAQKACARGLLETFAHMTPKPERPRCPCVGRSQGRPVAETGAPGAPPAPSICLRVSRARPPHRGVMNRLCSVGDPERWRTWRELGAEGHGGLRRVSGLLRPCEGRWKGGSCVTSPSSGGQRAPVLRWSIGPALTSPSGDTEVPEARWVPLPFSSSGSRGKEETHDHSGHLCANAAFRTHLLCASICAGF